MSVNYYDKDIGELVPIAKGTLYADAPVGSIQAYGGTTAPSGWLLCQGQAVSRTEYAELFKAIGTAFGTGDGSTTFNVPDLRETVPVGSGTRESGVTEHDVYTVGEFKDDQLQDHKHYEASNAGGTSQVWGNVASADGLGSGWYTGIIKEGRRGTTTHGKQLGVNYIIKAKQTPIPADIQSAIEEQNSYSTEETYTGKVWIDGKKIYRKCFTGAIATYTDSGKRRLFQSDALLSDVSDIVSVGGSCTFNTDPTSTSAQWIKIGSIWVNTELVPVYVANIIKSSTDARLYGACDQNTILTKLTYKLAVEYTKIT